VIDSTVTQIVSDINAKLTNVTATVDKAHTALRESMNSLHSALYAYKSSTEISDTFVL